MDLKPLAACRALLLRLSRPRTSPVSRWRQTDRAFVTIIAGVFAFNFGVARAITGRPALPPSEPLVEEVFRRRTGPWPTSKPPVAKVVSKAPASSGPARVAKAEARPVRAPSSSELKQTVSGKGLLGAVNAIGAGWTITDDLAGHMSPGGLEEAMKGARQAGVEDGRSERRGAEVGVRQEIGGLETEGGARPDEKGPVVVARRPPSVTFAPDPDEPTAPGCDGAAIARQVKRNLTAIQRCYEDAIKRAPGLQGKVTVRFTVGTDGRITDVEIDEDTVHSGALASCIERRFRSWSFGTRAEAECVFSHPFVFAPVLP